jgi:osmotically-inducible protein OsmY
MKPTTMSSLRQRHPVRTLVTTVTLAASAAAALGALQGCVAVAGTAVVGGAMMATDRRTSGTQIDDQSIEMKAASRIHDSIADRGNVSVTSYNRLVLVTGEVPTDADKAAVIKAIQGIENVGTVQDELLVGPSSSASTRTSDTLITSKVKTAMLEAKDLESNAIKVVTERGIVYLMGRVTDREATRATDIARTTSGVLKVVRVFEIVTEADLASIQNK